MSGLRSAIQTFSIRSYYNWRNLRTSRAELSARTANTGCRLYLLPEPSESRTNHSNRQLGKDAFPACSQGEHCVMENQGGFIGDIVIDSTLDSLKKYAGPALLIGCLLILYAWRKP